MFGDEYTTRNNGRELIESNKLLFEDVFTNLPFPNSVIELGSNRGLNLAALKEINKNIHTTGVETNSHAASTLRQSTFADAVHEISVTKLKIDAQSDLVLSKGLLIHINPDDLKTVYSTMAALAADLVLIAEYFSAEPTSMVYRGSSNKLFKRDFAGEFLDANQEFKVLRTSFVYTKGPIPKDNLTWFLLKRRK